MNFLTVFEHRIGSLFGATDQGLTAPFSFKKLAKKAAREMEAETYVIDGADTAPALYTILVSTEDDLAMRPLYLQLTGETARFIEGQARDKGYVFVAPPLVRFMADPSLRSGHFSVFAENVDVRTLSRLREEEAKFMGAGASLAGGLGGAAFEQLPHANARRPQQSAVHTSRWRGRWPRRAAPASRHRRGGGRLECRRTSWRSQQCAARERAVARECPSSEAAALSNTRRCGSRSAWQAHYARRCSRHSPYQRLRRLRASCCPAQRGAARAVNRPSSPACLGT